MVKMIKLNATDILAGLIVTGGLILKACRINGIIDTLLVAVTSFYFGLRAYGYKTRKSS